MPLEPLSPAVFAFIAQVDEAYASLMRVAGPRPNLDLDANLGGKLFYAGNLTEPARAATVAANIAGAATLAASADQAAAKQAMRAGTVDFLVNSLDEALRILKNEIRKRETVAVCVTANSAAIELEMRDRGVQPDIFFSDLAAPESREVSCPTTVAATDTWLSWRTSQAPALWLPKLDAIALAALAPTAPAARRWLQRAPRYLGRLAQNTRVLRTSDQHAEQFIAQVTAQIAAGAISVAVEIELGPWGSSRRQPLVPSPSPEPRAPSP